METRYEDVVMGSCPVQIGPVKDWYTVTILAPNIRRLTTGKQIKLGKQLWKFSGRSEESWDVASEVTQLRWSQSHMAKYYYVEICDEPNDTYSYRSDSSLGGNYPKSDLLIVN